MVQREVAERICAPRDTKQYGSLSVWIQCHAKPKLEKRIGPGAFTPPPKVDSAVISLIPTQDIPPYPEALQFVLHVCFQQRRKQIGGIFRKKNLLYLLEALEENHIDPTVRPEQLSCQDFLLLAASQKYSSPNK